MTEKQEERLRKKIKKVKSELAADKRRWGGYYDDSRGIRYLPLGYYIKLLDFKGGLRYLKWFNKNFPDDMAFPTFHFEATLILFNAGRIAEAEKKAFITFCSNTYLFDAYFGMEIKDIDKYEWNPVEEVAYAEEFDYANQYLNFPEFSEWLTNFLQSESFVKASNIFTQLSIQLKDVKVSTARTILLDQRIALQEDF